MKFRISLDPETIGKLDSIAAALDTGRSGAVAFAVSETPVPKRRRKK